MSAPRLSPSPASLKLFDPDAPPLDPPPPPSACAWSLRDCWEQLVRPELAGRKPDTVAEYELHLRRWEAWVGGERSAESGGGRDKPDYTRIVYPGVVPSDCSGSPRSAPPRSALPDKPQLLAWRTWLATLKDDVGRPLLSPRSVNKHVGSLTAILRAAADEGHLPRAPRVAPLPCRKAAQKLYLEPEELSAVYEACAAARWPRNLLRPAPDYWRALLVLWANYGLRTEEAVRYGSRHRALCGANISWAEVSPLKGSRGKCEFGWLQYVPEKQERAKPEALTLPLNRVTHAHLRAIEPPGGWRPEAAVFPFPLSNKSFYATWRAIVEKSGVRPPAGSDEPHYLPCHLRKTCTTLHNRHTRGAAQWITGHADDRGDVAELRLSRVSREHYDNPELSLVEHIATFPQPEAFLAIFGDAARQRLLF